VEKKYRVTLTPEERADLERMTRTGKAAATKLTHARILLLADENPGGPARSDGQIIEALGVSKNTVCRVRERFVEQGFESALVRKPTSRKYARKLDGRGEAHLIALACSDPPAGRADWTLQMLADQLVAMGHADTLSYETVRQVLKKTKPNRG
jgi:transposase